MDVLGPLKTLLNPVSGGSAGQTSRAGAGEEGSDFSAILADGDAPRPEAIPTPAHNIPGERRILGGQTGTEATEASQPPGAAAGENEGHAASGGQMFQPDQRFARGTGLMPATGGDVADMAGEVLASRTEWASAEHGSAADGPAPGQRSSGKSTGGDGAPDLPAATGAGRMEPAASGSGMTSPAADPKRQPRQPPAGEAAQVGRYAPPESSRAGAIPARPAPAADAPPKAYAAVSSGWRKAEVSPASPPLRGQAEPGRTGQEPRFRSRAASDPLARQSADTARQQETLVGTAGKSAKPAAQAGPADAGGPALPSAGVDGALVTGRTHHPSAVPRMAAPLYEAQSPVGDRAGQAGAAFREAGTPARGEASASKGVQQASAVTVSETGGISGDARPSGTAVTSSGPGKAEPDQTTQRLPVADAAQPRDQVPSVPRAHFHPQRQQTADLAVARPSRPVDASRRFERPASGMAANDPSVSRSPAQRAEGRQPMTGRGSEAPLAEWHAARPSSLQPVAAGGEARPNRVPGSRESTPRRYPASDGAAPSVSTARAVDGASKVSLAGIADAPVSSVKTALSDVPVLGGASAPVTGAEAQPAALATLTSLPSQPGAALEAVRQLVDALPGHAAGDRTVLSLDPAELGHLEIEFKQDHGRMTATVNVERPETLDLLRRHADMLMRDLAAAGYAEAEVAFGDATAFGQRDQGRESGLPGTDDGDARASEAGPATEPASRPRGMIAGRLDIRL